MLWKNKVKKDEYVVKNASLEAVAKAKIEKNAHLEAEKKAKAEEKIRLEVEAEAKAKAEAEVKTCLEADAKTKIEEKACVETQAKAKEEKIWLEIEAEVKAKAESENDWWSHTCESLKMFSNVMTRKELILWLKILWLLLWNNNYLNSWNTLGWFIYFSQKFSVLWGTEISVVRPQYRNFCAP